MTSSPKFSTRLGRMFIGAIIGASMHMVAVGGGLAVATIIGVVVGTTKTAEGAFWGFFIALLSCPSGILTGAVTGFAGSIRERTWRTTALVGAIPALMSGLMAWAVWASMGQPNLTFPAIVTGAGFFIAAGVALIGRSTRAS